MRFYELIEKYPEYFPKQRKTDSYVGPGWVPLVEHLCQFIKGKESEKGVIFKFRFDQIKEKFGTLRIYYVFQQDNITLYESAEQYVKFDAARNQVIGFSNALISVSSHTCEETGKPGKLRKSTGWFRTLCDETAKDLGYTD